MAGKAELALMKTPAIPRLELLGKQAFEQTDVKCETSGKCFFLLTISKKRFWTNFQVTLAWMFHKRKNLKLLLKTGCKKSVETVT